jgi:hypothetical protein
MKLSMQETQALAKDIQRRNTQSYKEGVRYALDYLREVYGEGIEETDIWADYMNEETN